MNRFDTVVFMDYAPLTEKIYNDFYFKDIIAKGINVQYWDVSFVINHHSALTPYHGEESTITITSKRHFNEEVKKHKGRTLYVPIMTYNGLVLSLFLIMSFHRCKIAVFGINTIPAPTFSSKRVLSESKITASLLKRVILNRLSVIFKKIGLIRNIDYIFTSGTKGLNGFGRTTAKELQKAEIININSVDYDKGLNMTEDEESPVEGDYIVFLDEYIPFHPDVVIAGLKVIDSDYYYFYLNRFFDLVEKQLGIPVVIAAHPKAEKYKEHNYFNGRKVLFYKTTLLCKNAKLVLAHDSTSINNAVFYNKPILLMLYRKMQQENMFTYNSTMAFAEALHAQTVYVDEEDTVVNVPEVDPHSYNEYRYRYMTSPETLNVDSQTVFIHFLCTNE